MWGDDKKKDDERPDPLKELNAKLAEQDERLKALDKLSALDGLQGEFDEIKARLGEIEAGGALQHEQQRQQQQPGVMTSFLVDENKAFAERAMPLAAMQLQTAARVAKMSARNKLVTQQRDGDPYYGQRMARIFDKFEGDIDKKATGVPLAQQTHDETWINLFNLVRGEHIEEILAAEKKGEKSVFTESGASSIAPGSVDNPVNPDTMTDEQKRIAKRMGISEDDYMKSRKELVYG